MRFFSHIISRTPAFLAGVLLILCNYNSVFSQNVVNQGEGAQASIKFFDADGKLFVNPYKDVEGTPFFFDNWKYGKVKLADNRVFSNTQLKLDLLNQEVHFLKPGNVEMVTPQLMIREITFFDSTTSTPVSYFFKCGFPAIDNQDEKNFYQILSDGKIEFLEALRKIIHTDKNEYTATTQKEFRQYEDYYLFIDDKMYRLKKDKKSILDLLKPNEAKIETYVSDNKLSYKSIDDIKKIIDYYNSLP